MQTNLDLNGLPPKAVPAIRDYATHILNALENRVEAITLTGSILTADYIPGSSDINSAVVVTSTDTGVLDNVAVLGRRYGRKGFRAPLLLTREHIRSSLDAFPVEFLDLRVLHKTIYGAELFSDIAIDNHLLRLQCERDLKSRLINLRQGYIAASGHKSALSRLIMEAYNGLFPLLRAILFLKGCQPVIEKAAVLGRIEMETGISMRCLIEITRLRQGGKRGLGPDLGRSLFAELYRTTHELSALVDTLSV